MYHAPEDPNYPAYLQNLPQLAKYLERDEHILIALVAKEAGWQNPPEVTEKESIRHNIELNNPFGVNEIDEETGEAVGNMEFDSLAQALSFWMNQPKTDDLYPAAIYRRNPFPYSRRLQLAKMFAQGHLTADDIADALLCEGRWKGMCSKKWNKKAPEKWRTRFKELYPSSAVGWKDACSDTCDLK